MISRTNVDGIKGAVGEAFRKAITEYDHEIIAIPVGDIHAHDLVVYETNELIAVCPLTGLPDIYKCVVEAIVNGMVPELKTLKFYYMSFKDVGILHEDLVAQVADALQEKCDFMWCRVTLDTNIRGGISTLTQATRGRFLAYAPERGNFNAWLATQR